MTTHQDTATDEPLAPGDLVLNRYRVQRRLESGGHSVVYVATDTHLCRDVCVKAFRKLGDQGRHRETAYEHFVQEAYALSSLTHPNTLRIYDFGEAQDRSRSVPCPIQVSEYMPGGTLSQRIRNSGPTPVASAIPMLCKLANALAEAHRKGIVHRDIKPQNILFTADGVSGEPKLADFGIAKFTLPEAAEFQARDTCVVVGHRIAMFSASWASPEQLTGAAPIPSSDIFSLGLIAAYVLSGRSVLASRSAQEGYEKRKHAAELLSSVLQEASIGLHIRTVIEKACSFKAANRYQNCTEFSEALEAARKTDASEIEDAPTTLSLPLRAKGTRPPLLKSLPPLATRFALPCPPQQSSAHRIHPHTGDQWFGTRQCFFVSLDVSATVNVGAHRLKVVCTPHPGSIHGQTLTILGLTTFLCKVGSRVSRSLHIDDETYLDIVDMKAQARERLFVSFGRPEQGDTLFRLGSPLVRIDAARCRNAVLLDSPSHHTSFIFYQPPTAN